MTLTHRLCVILFKPMVCNRAGGATQPIRVFHAGGNVGSRKIFWCVLSRLSQRRQQFCGGKHRNIMFMKSQNHGCLGSVQTRRQATAIQEGDGFLHGSDTFGTDHAFNSAIHNDAHSSRVRAITTTPNKPDIA